MRSIGSSTAYARPTESRRSRRRRTSWSRGLPTACSNHAMRLVSAACDMLDTVDKYNRTRALRNQPQLHVKIGIHTGKVCAGVLGATKLQYDVFGDTVNLASRLTTSAEWRTIQISASTEAIIRGSFDTIDRGEVLLKGKGLVRVFVIDRNEDRVSAAADTLQNDLAADGVLTTQSMAVERHSGRGC